MPVKFCSTCGKKISYELQVPNYCPSCGKSLNAALKPTTSTTFATKQPIQQYNQSSSNLPESDEVDFNLIDQLKANLQNGLRQMEVTVSDIPEFRVPLDRIIGKDNNTNNK